eukprot:evm.model.scf_666.11 EVM.evm.TU.scf_666.11   scf_666:56364-58714(-)
METGAGRAVCLLALFFGVLGVAADGCEPLVSRLASACPERASLGASGDESLGFASDCCRALARLNDSGCLCENDLRDLLWNDLDSRHFVAALVDAGRPPPAGCGLSVFASFGSEDCSPVRDLFTDHLSDLRGGQDNIAEGTYATARRLQAQGNCKGGGHIIKVLEGFKEAFGELLEGVNSDQDVSELLRGDGPVTMFTPISTGIQVEIVVDGSTVVEDVDTTLKRHIVLGSYPTKKLRGGDNLTAENVSEPCAATERTFHHESIYKHDTLRFGTLHLYLWSLHHA